MSLNKFNIDKFFEEFEQKKEENRSIDVELIKKTFEKLKEKEQKDSK